MAEARTRQVSNLDPSMLKQMKLQKTEERAERKEMRNKRRSKRQQNQVRYRAELIEWTQILLRSQLLESAKVPKRPVTSAFSYFYSERLQQRIKELVAELAVFIFVSRCTVKIFRVARH